MSGGGVAWAFAEDRTFRVLERPEADLDAWCAKQSVIQVASEKALDLPPPHIARVARKPCYFANMRSHYT